MANPLTPAIHRDTDQELDLDHLKGGRVSVPQQIPDESAVVGDLFRTLAITDAGRLHDGTVLAHHVDQTDETVVQNGEFLPAEFFYQFSSLSHPSAPSHAIDGWKIKGVSVGEASRRRNQVRHGELLKEIVKTFSVSAEIFVKFLWTI